MGTWEANAAFEKALREEGSPEADAALREAMGNGANIHMVANNWSAAMFAAARGRAAALSMLIGAGAGVGMSSSHSGRSAAHLAAEAGSSECLGILAKAGADMEAVDKEGWTPLMLAALGGHRACARALALAGADLDSRSGSQEAGQDDDGNGGSAPFAREWIIGRDAKHMADQGLSAAMIAAIGGDAAMLALLLELGASPHVKSRSGLDARMFSSMLGRSECQELFKALDERGELAASLEKPKRRSGPGSGSRAEKEARSAPGAASAKRL